MQPRLEPLFQRFCSGSDGGMVSDRAGDKEEAIPSILSDGRALRTRSRGGPRMELGALEWQ